MSSREESSQDTLSLSASLFTLDELPGPEAHNDSSEDPPAVGPIAHDVLALQARNFSRRLVELKEVAYCNASYPLHYTRNVTLRGHYRFVVPDTEIPYKTVLFGEVLSMADGTKLSAVGNHNTSFSPVVPITDKSQVKDVLVLGAPTVATRNLLSQYDNQIITFLQMRQQHIEEEARERSLVAAATPILKPLLEGGRERISITLPLKYVVSSSFVCSHFTLIVS
jgi:hypothetical protein